MRSITGALVLTAAAISLNGLLTNANPRYTGFILMGGTGDLARKYLWQALFDAYVTRAVTEEKGDGAKSWKFTLFAGGSSHMSVATNRLKDIFDNHVKCADRHGSSSVCAAKKGDFFLKISYFQLHGGEDYSAMCETMEQKLNKDKREGVKKEVILYLSTPPSVVQPVLKHFKAQCPFSESKAAVKVVLEKPQGHDWASADKLSEELLDMFQEDQLYRTDHYLAKSVVSNMLPFRAANPQLEKFLNKDYVERVDIFLKESIGVEERYASYNDMGVIRDVFQNHLIQLLTLVALDLPANLTTSPGAIDQSKIHVLKRVNRASKSSTLLGQYSTYTADAAKEIRHRNITALVPTFAAALLKLHLPRWLDVPFLLVSGKKLAERSSYVRILFKDRKVCVSHCDDTSHHGVNSATADKDTGRHHRPHHQYHLPKSTKQQIIFQIGHGPAKRPLISVSKSLGEPEIPESLKEINDPDIFSTEHSYHGDHPENFFHMTPVNNADAYSTVIEDVLHGHRENFVSTSQLLLAWQIWEKVLEFSPTRPPRLYEAGDPNSLLNFVMKGDDLEFAAQFDQEVLRMETVHHMQQAQMPATFLGRRMVSGTTEGVTVQLAREIEQAAESEIASKGVFHLAFSGGTTPILLWQTLAQSFASEYWAHVHVWQVDERCVKAAADTHSNLFQLDRQLLRFVAVPWAQVHAMPVDVAGRLCDPELQGDRHYADSLRHSVNNLQLDFVVLGVGTDGHTASLFPHSPALNADSQTLVTVTDQGPKDTPRRMTMTLPLINRAKRVAVLATGEKKARILDALEESEGGQMGVVDTYPIIGVNPENGTLSWFIDYKAYFGDDFSFNEDLEYTGSE